MAETRDEHATSGLMTLAEDSQRALEQLQAVATSDAAEVLEIAVLRRQLEHQKAETANAVLAASELRRQIQEVQEAPKKKKKAWNGVSTPISPGQAPKDVQKLKGDVDRAQAALDMERKARKFDMDRAAQEIEELKESLHSGPRPVRIRKSHAGTWKALVTVLLLLGVLCGAVFTVHRLPIIQAALSVWDIKEEPPKPPPEKPTEAIESDTIGKLAALAGQTSEFSKAIGRLDRVLGSIPGRPQDVLRAVHKMKSTPENSVCGFEWANGQPAIVYEGNRAGNHSMTISATVNSCADAVEEFLAKAEKDAATPLPKP